jgi:hypothetical protein
MSEDQFNTEDHFFSMEDDQNIEFTNLFDVMDENDMDAKYRALCVAPAHQSGALTFEPLNSLQSPSSNTKLFTINLNSKTADYDSPLVCPEKPSFTTKTTFLTSCADLSALHTLIDGSLSKNKNYDSSFVADKCMVSQFSNFRLV